MRSLFVALTLLLCSCSGGNRYVIEGTTAQSGGYYYLFKGYDLVDSAEVVAGCYRFEGEIDSLIPVRNVASTNLKDMSVTTRFAQVILEAGTIKVVEDDNSPTGGLVVSGTKANDAIYNFAVKGSQIQQSLEFVYSREQREEYAKQYNKLVVKTIERNLKNFASIYMLSISGGRFTDEQKLKYLNSMAPSVQRTMAAENLREKLQTVK